MAKFKVSISPLAEGDIRQIAAYLREHGGVDAAVGFITAIESKVDSLEQFPDRGAIPTEIRAMGLRRYRQLLLSPWRIFYRIGHDAVSIILVADGRRDTAALLRERLTGKPR